MEGWHKSEKNNVIVDKTYSFSLQIIKVYHQLKAQHEYEIGRQLLRCATSIGANVNEATAGQSRADFIAKMSIASKESRETRYWLRLIKDSNILGSEVEKELKDIDEIIAILTSIVKTAQTR